MENSKGDIEIIESVSDHIQKHIGEIAIVFHEKVSTDVHIDVTTLLRRELVLSIR